jgi:hypothetical protein
MLYQAKIVAMLLLEKGPTIKLQVSVSSYVT